MHYLAPALWAEGPTDYRFLPPLLTRLLVDVLKDAIEPVELADFHPLDDVVPRRSVESRAARITASAQHARDAFHLLFIHADGAGDPERAFSERVFPAVSMLREKLGDSHAAVGVVPLRETEAWAIADGDALRAAFRTSLSDADLGLPELHEVERCPDPKRVLEAAHRAVGPRHFQRSATAHFLEKIAENLRLAQLRGLPAFRRHEADLRRVLGDMGRLPRCEGRMERH